MSKLVLTHPDVLQIVIETLFDQAAVEHYTPYPTEWPNGTASDVAYVADSDDYNPVLIEVQRNVDNNFLLRLISYCVCAQRQYQKPPHVLVFVISRINDSIRTRMVPNERQPYLLDYPCEPWAHTCHFIDTDSIRNHISKPLRPFIALSSFLIDEQPSLLTHTNQPDATIRKLYVIAKRIFDDYLSKEDMLLDRYRRFSDSVQGKLSTALSFLQEDVPKVRQRRRTEQVLQEGISIAQALSRQLQGAEGVEDVDESAPAAPTAAAASSSQSLSSSSIDGYAFVQSWLDSHEWTSIPWSTIFEEAKQHGHFQSFSTWSSVKSGYYRWKKNH